MILGSAGGLIGGQLRPSGGTIMVVGQNISELRIRDLYELRKRMGMMFQSARPPRATQHAAAAMSRAWNSQPPTASDSMRFGRSYPGSQKVPAGAQWPLRRT